MRNKIVVTQTKLYFTMNTKKCFNEKQSDFSKTWAKK